LSNFRHWGSEIGFVILVATLGLLIGLVTGSSGEILLVLALLYLTWHLRQLYRLRRWLSESRSLYPPESIGIWSDIFHSIYLLQRKNRKSRQRLSKILSEFRASTAALPDGAIVLDEQGEIIWFNKAAEHLLGLNNKQDIGQRIVNLLRNPRFVAYFEQENYSLPVEIDSPINRHLKLSLRIIPYSKKQRLLVVRDISRITQLEKIRQDFVANVSHELRTPLTVVNGYLEIFNDAKDQLPLFFHRPIAQMGEQIKRMRALVDDLLTLSKLESNASSINHQEIKPHHILAKIVDEAKVLSGGNHHIQFDCHTDLAIKGNEQELTSAFSNLIFNAVRYTPAGGLITVSWKETEQGLVMSVSDNGPGIEAIHIPRLTERFYRVDDGRDRDSGGTGLGLAIVKHVLERHGSYLMIESKPGEGSRFSCRFDPIKSSS
jgi:two-component system phosphate regulon sensor histidine kinase PhoR